MKSRVIEITGELINSSNPAEDLTIRLDHFNMIKRLLVKLRDKKLLITIRELEYKRSDAQNRYIHGVVVPTVRAFIKETQGEDKTHDEVYTWLRVGLLEERPVIKTILGQEVVVMSGKRFSQMSTKEFAEAIDIIVNRMEEMGCEIQLPKRHNVLNEYLGIE